MVKFILLGTQRTGSSFLGNCLNSHPAIASCEELFMPRNKSLTTYRPYRTSSIGRRLTNLFMQDRLIRQYLQQFIDSHPPDIGAVGFSLMYNQARRYPAVLGWCRDNQVRIIHLIRQNTLKILVSREVAKKRRIQNKAIRAFISTRPLERVTIFLNVATLQSDLGRINALIDYYRMLLLGENYMETHYEAFVSMRESESARILGFLGVQIAPLTSKIVKTGSDSLSEIIQNFDEVCQELAGTQYEQFLN